MKTDWSLETLAPLAASYGLRTMGVLVALWLSFVVARWVQVHVTRGLSSRKFDQTLAIFFGNLLRWMILIASLLACLSLFGIETTSFAAIIGAAGLAIGLAFQGTLSNFAAGVMLLVFRPFKVGDYVVAGGKEGTVMEVGLFVTAIDSPDNRRMFVPNTAIGAAVIENYTAHPLRRVDITVHIASNEDIDSSRKALEAAGAEVAARDATRGAEVFLQGFGAGMVIWQVRVWAPASRYWEVWEETVRAIGYGLAKAGVSMPSQNMNLVVSGTADNGSGLPSVVPGALPAAH
jgi:small conductance mechanosensitive channel